MKISLFSKFVCVLLMAGTAYIISISLSSEREDTKVSTLSTDLTPSIPVERGVFSRSSEALSYQQMPEGNRSLAAMKKNRAYPGAPPMIPHALLSKQGIGDKSCLQCHENGGYVNQFNAFAPITPHPDFLNCVQCHVAKKTSNLFKGTNWKNPDFVKLQKRAMEGAPPMIPHTLQLRENCLACHAGSAAPKEIRVSHPERVNCRQCHLPVNTKNEFVKPNPVEGQNKSLGHKQEKLDEKEVAQIKDWITKK